MDMVMKNKLKIQDYLDYREFLGEYYRVTKEQDPNFSYRSFSSKVGVKAPNFLQWLIEGKRNLAIKTVPAVIKALGLDEKGAEYFRILVEFGQAKTIKSKSKLFLQLVKIRKTSKLHIVSHKQYEYYSHWYSQAIRELVSYYSFNKNDKSAYRKLGAQLAPSITESEAKKAVQKMLDLGLLTEEKNGRIVQAKKIISTGNEVSSLLVRKYHQSVIELASESLDRFSPNDRDVSAISMSISRECFDLIKKEVQLFRKHILDVVKADKKPSDVYQMNFQFFPMARVRKDD